MKALVTGAAGYIGSTLVDRLLAEGWSVKGVDNLSTGRMQFLETAQKNKQFQFFERDLIHPHALDGVLTSDTDWVFHLAANADVKDGLLHPTKDLEQNVQVTCRVLEAMRATNVKRIAFSSTGSVYGEAAVIPTPENAPFPIQTSLYAASKLSAEGFISAYAEGYGFKARIFRFVSLLGPRYTHGHVVDFVKQLAKDGAALRVLGDGSQRKSYLHVDDCVSAVLKAVAHKPDDKIEIYNLGTDEYITVKQSIATIVAELGLTPTLNFSGGDRGWVGDNPFIYLDTKKIRSIGWQPVKTIEQSVRETVRYLRAHPWIFSPEARPA